ncbi:glycine zipper 2TM domain-containing protein [Cupriavidus sp. 2KB_3]|uniref:glycine zipper 2TM domain-containing protein n=1 Tax=Cupriavidus TaxID=106589 RepID=UPI0011EE7B9D|nr:glycine zipper 2TM domain-containing protein [Cupriavidus campinensis]
MLATRRPSLLHRPLAAMLLASTLLASGCAEFAPPGSVYSAGQTSLPQTVTMATVERVRVVQIDDSSQGSSLVGELGGGLLGAVAGSAIGHGHGSLLAGVAGGLAGGLAGHEIESRVERHPGYEITVRLPDGRLQAITQPASEGSFYPGQRVQLLWSEDGKVRVTA